MTQHISLSARVPMEASGQRLDQIAAQLFPDYSRSRIQEWIKRGELTVAGCAMKVNAKVNGGEQLIVAAESEPQGEWQAQDIPLNIVFEDDQLLVINKPAGLVVHPAAGNYQGTLLNGLLFYLPNLAEIPRAGIVHRLDKDTTGLMVVAKTLVAQSNLVKQLQLRRVKRIYRALVQGRCKNEGVVEGAIGRDPQNRKKMAVVERGGKEARTHYKVLQRFDELSLLELALETGRTHQIRVHMAAQGYPLVGDGLYGRPLRRSQITDNDQRKTLNEFGRQALHACQLSLLHPVSDEQIGWTVPLPEDFSQLLNDLQGTLDV